MAAKGFQPVRALPRSVLLTASAVIGFHLFALGILVLAVQAGPWWVDPLSRVSTTPPPQFAGMIGEWTTFYYLRPLGLGVDGHFDSNRTMNPTVRLEVHLTKDQDGAETILTFPDPRANSWVRQRQSLLIQRLGEDQPHARDNDPAVKIAAPGSKADTEIFFFPENLNDPDSSLVLFKAPRYEFRRLIAENRTSPFFYPSEPSMILIKSFVRHLQREYGVTKVELVRQSRQPRLPMLMFPNRFNPDKLLLDELAPDLSPDYLKTLVSRFGDGEPKEWSGIK